MSRPIETPAAKILKLLGIGVTIVLASVFFISQFQSNPDNLLADTEPYLVKDIYSGPTGSDLDASIVLNSELYFEADDGISGVELWKSDGTESGTVMVKDIYPGATDGEPENFAVFDGNVYMYARDAANGAELWKSDGTESGTVMVKDINPGTDDSAPFGLLASGDYLYFIAEDGTNGRELWRTDGTESGTAMVKDINTSPGFGSNISVLTDFNGVLYFSANDDINGQELWKSNGTEVGTEMVKDINVAGNSDITAMIVFNGVLYLAASNADDGQELWKSDGTEVGTVMVKDINPGPGSSELDNFTAGDGVLYFSATQGTSGGELWKSDGTESGTVMIKDINVGSGDSRPDDFIMMDGILYFFADDNVGGENFELWRSDGTESGTTKVKEINVGGNSEPYLPYVVNNNLYFSADDGLVGYEFWKSDGTESGTVLVKDMNPGPDGSYAYIMGVVDSLIYIGAEEPTYGGEVWAYVASDEDSSGIESTDTDAPSDDFGDTDFEITSVSGTDVDGDSDEYPVMYATSDTPDIEFAIIRDESGIEKYELRLTATDSLGRKKGNDYAWIEDIDADSPTNSKPRVRDNMEIRYRGDKIIVEPSEKRKLADGTYYLMVRAFDNAGNHTDSDEIKLVIGQVNGGNVVLTSIGSIPYNPAYKTYYYASNTLVLNGTGKGNIKIDEEVIPVDGFILKKQLTTGSHTVTVGINTFKIQIDPTRATFPDSLK